MGKKFIILGVSLFYLIGWIYWVSHFPKDWQTGFIISTIIGVIWWTSSLYELKQISVLAFTALFVQFFFTNWHSFDEIKYADSATFFIYLLIHSLVTLIPVYIMKEDWIDTLRPNHQE